MKWLIEKIDPPKVGIELFNYKHPDLVDSALQQQGLVEYWQRRAAIMAGDMSTTPGGVLGRLHKQTEAGLQPLFKQASQALNKEGL
ncbi:TPA: hypothetical protein DEP94_02075 [Candidatus Nomurabacteria bacterium]|nr:hypothetical protein [Candidatus Nomurabacteria bacterium]